MTDASPLDRRTPGALTVSQAIADSARQLSGDTAQREARMLLAHALDCDQSWLIAHAHESLEPKAHDRLHALVSRRERGEPIAYLTGRRAFYDVELAITPAVLIPRPETETLVDAAIALLERAHAPRVADLGTGSGALAIAVARALPRAEVWAIELSAQALVVARGNVERLCPGRVRLLRANWATALAADAFDLVLANPPYVASDDEHLERGDVAFEPRLALDGGHDGLDAYRAFAVDAARALRPGGWLAVEHGFEQAQMVRELLAGVRLTAIRTQRDLGGHERVTLAQRADSGLRRRGRPH